MADLKFKDSNATFEIVTDEEMYADIQKAIQSIVVVGASYSIVGGRSFSFASLPELRELLADYEERILAARGESGVFHGDTGGNYNDEEATS